MVYILLVCCLMCRVINSISTLPVVYTGQRENQLSKRPGYKLQEKVFSVFTAFSIFFNFAYDQRYVLQTAVDSSSINPVESAPKQGVVCSTARYRDVWKSRRVGRGWRATSYIGTDRYEVKPTTEILGGDRHCHGYVNSSASASPV